MQKDDHSYDKFRQQNKNFEPRVKNEMITSNFNMFALEVRMDYLIFLKKKHWYRNSHVEILRSVLGSPPPSYRMILISTKD